MTKSVLINECEVNLIIEKYICADAR